MGTSWETVINAFIFKIQNCPEFFNFYNVTEGEAIDIAIKRSKGFLLESIARLTSQCTPDVDFYDFGIDKDEDLEDEVQWEKFNFEITQKEIDLLATLMFEAFLSKDIAKLRVGVNALTSKDLSYTFSGWNERRTFMEMYKQVQANSKDAIDKYSMLDRKTGKRKKITYDM